MTRHVDMEFKRVAAQTLVIAVSQESCHSRVHYHHLQSRVYNFRSKPSRLADSELLASEGGIEQLWKR